MSTLLEEKDVVEDGYERPKAEFCDRAARFVRGFGGRVGKTLIIGTSTFDFWRSDHLDSNGNYIAGYLADLQDFPKKDENGLPDVLNFGIGATRWDDWLSFYQPLVKDFAPSALVLTCGGNDFATGRPLERVYGDFERFMRLFRADFATVPVYFLFSSPSPCAYASYWPVNLQYKAKINAFAQRDGYMKTIDLANLVADENGPIKVFWDADNIHLNREGYAILGKEILNALLAGI